MMKSWCSSVPTIKSPTQKKVLCPDLLMCRNVPCVIFQEVDQLLGSAIPLGNLRSVPGVDATEQDDSVLHFPTAVVRSSVLQGVAPGPPNRGQLVTACHEACTISSTDSVVVHTVTISWLRQVRY